MPNIDEFVSGFFGLFVATITMFMGFTVAGQMTTLFPLVAAGGILAGAIMMTKQNKLGGLDLRFVRRLVFVLGLVTTISVWITGIVLSGFATSLTLGSYLALGRATWPVFTTMALTIIGLCYQQFHHNNS